MLRFSMLALLSLVTLACRAHAPVNPNEEPSAAKQPTCADRLAEPETLALLEDLRSAADAPEVWPDYHLARGDLLLEWLGDGHHCIAHWSRGEIVEVARAETPIQTPLGIYGILLTDLAQASEAERFGFLAGNVPDAIVRSLRERDAYGALVWVVNTEKVAADFAPDEATKRILTEYFLHHESAHVHLLFAPLFGKGNHPRPTWAVQAKESEILARCYEAEGVKDTFARERAALADAVAAIEADDTAAVRRHSLEFIAYREQRYEALKSVRVPTQKQGEVSCAEAEGVWEIDEGGADYIAIATLQAAGIPLPGDQSAAERIRTDKSNEPYYSTGAGQLLVLRHLFPEDFLGIIRTTLNSTSFAGGIHGVLAERLGRTRSVELSSDLHVRPLADGVWLHVSMKDLPGFGPTPSNGLVIFGSEGALLIDTPWTTGQTKTLVEWIEGAQQSRLTDVVFTHAHGDRTGGVAALPKAARLHARAQTVELAGKLGRVFTADPLADLGSLHVGDVRIETFFPGAGHAPDNLVVWLPEQQLLFGGCFVKSTAAAELGNIADANLPSWSKALQRVREWKPEAVVVVPGHGELGGQELLAHTSALLEAGLK